jgi:hypothetical protein
MSTNHNSILAVTEETGLNTFFSFNWMEKQIT